MPHWIAPPWLLLHRIAHRTRKFVACITLGSAHKAGAVVGRPYNKKYATHDSPCHCRGCPADSRVRARPGRLRARAGRGGSDRSGPAARWIWTETILFLPDSRLRRPASRLCALLLQLLHLGRPAGPLPRRHLRSAGISQSGNRQGAAAKDRGHRFGKQLLPRAVGGAGLEYPGHRLLSGHGSRVSGRMAQCARHRRRASTAGRYDSRGCSGQAQGGWAVRIRVIGGGLAGPEAALTAARLGCHVDLYEMRALVDGKPRLTPAHQTIEFGELVCSNSLKSESPNTAPWLLKQEMRRAGSALLRFADATAVPAGHALAVDRVEFSRLIGEAIAAHPAIRVIREEVTTLDPNDNGTKCTIVATGPLTSDALSREIERITGSGRLAFYDSISPIVDAETIEIGR